jgi:hypothetical protein
MSARFDQVLAICMLLAGGAIIASTDVGAQTVDQPSRYRAQGASKVYPRGLPPGSYDRGRVRGTLANPCGPGWHMGKDKQCYMN